MKSCHVCALIWAWQPGINLPMLLLLCILSSSSWTLTQQGLLAYTFFLASYYLDFFSYWPCHAWNKEGAQHLPVKSASFSSGQWFPVLLEADEGWCAFTCTSLSSESRLPLSCSHSCIQERSKDMEPILGKVGTKVSKEAEMFLDLFTAFIPMHFLLLAASQELLWQVLFHKISFILFLLRNSQAKRSPTGIFWTDASQTVNALNTIPKIFSLLLFAKKNINTGNIWSINKSLFEIQTSFFPPSSGLLCCDKYSPVLVERAHHYLNISQCFPLNFSI